VSGGYVLRGPGGELDADYASWAVLRLEEVADRSVEEWIAHDRQAVERRSAIR